MFDNLQALGIGLIGFALIIGIGTVVLHEFGASIAVCPNFNSTDTPYTFNSTENNCNLVFDNGTEISVNPADSGWVSTNYLMTELGSSGLAGWTPAIVALSVGMLFLGALFIGFGRGKRTY